MTEWRTVPSLPWLQASSDGKIRRIIRGQNGHALRELRGSISTAGYRVTCTRSGNTLKHNIGFHVLVCEAFHGPRPSSEHEVAHWDGNPTNNRADNLRWATARENAADRARHGTQSGSNHPAAKLLAGDVVAIRHLKAFGFRGSDIALMFDMNRNQINRIAAGTQWSTATVSGAANAVLSFSA